MMNKKIMLIIAIAIMAILAIVFIAIKENRANQQGTTKQQLLQKFQTLKTQYEQAKSQGYDVSEIERLGKEAEQAFNKGDYKKAKELLKNISDLLKKLGIPEPTPPETKEFECGNGVCESGECDSCADCKAIYAMPSGLSPKYEQKYNEMANWLNKKLIEWKPAEYKPMHFMGLLLTLTETYLEDTTIEDDLKFVEMLDEAGVDVITVPITGSPEDLTPAFIDRLDTIISEIRKRGKEVKVWSRFSMYPSKIRVQKMNSSAEYIVSRWHPEYYTIVHEPECDTLQGMQTNKETIERIVSIIKKIDSNVKIIAGVIAYKGRMDCVDYYAGIVGLDTVSMDVYNNWGLCEECSGGNAIEDKINLVHSKGKQVWFEEFWSSSQQDKTTSDEYDVAHGFTDPKRVWWDAQFIKMISYYAQKNGLIGIEPWFTNYFFFYPGYYPYGTSVTAGGKKRFSEQYLRDLRTAMDEKRRTPAFCAFKNIIKEVNQK